MKPDKKKALAHFKENVLPRRVRDHVREQEYWKRTGKAKVFFRKVLPDEQDRAEAYPVLSAGLGTFAHFGIGIGIYYMQLLIMGGVTLICGLIMVVAVHEYGNDYGSSSFFFTYTAACDNVRVIKDIKVDSCSGFEDCSNGRADLDYREDCELPFNAALADLAMSVFFFVMILVAKLAENKIEEELDEAVQTAQDYSVCVYDPTKDAEDPDEWYEFFSRFGKVRYVTITRKNKHLTRLVLEKHALTKKIQELHSAENAPEDREKLKSKEAAISRQYDEINRKLGAAYEKKYKICRVYVTFEREEGQRKCLREMEVADIYAILNLRGDTPRFRGVNTLDVAEPPEPDSVLWANIEMGRGQQLLRLLLSYILIALVLIAIFFAVLYLNQVSSLLLSMVIAVIDAVLPPVFQVLVDIGAPQSQGQRQSLIQMYLFLARLLLSIAFPYYFSSWNEAVSPAFIQQVVTVQMTASFLAPIIQGLDFAGIFSRHILGPFFADTQGELNAAYMGSKWTLAEKYTGIAKIVFLAVFYTLLNPFSPLIATLALVNVFLIDRFLLLRRLEPSCMLDSQIATRLRQQALLAIAAHMYITVRFIYSWPMDQVYRNSSGDFQYADKFPPYLPISYTSRDWHSRGQRNILAVYRIAFFAVAIVTLYVWVVDPLIRVLKGLFCYSLDIVGDVQGIGFSEISKVMAYVPLIQYKRELFFCSYIVDMLPKNKPSLIRASPGDKDDLSSYVPIQHQPHVLSIIKYYRDHMLEDAINEEDIESKNGDESGKNTEVPIGTKISAKGLSPDGERLGPSNQPSQKGILTKIVSGLPAELKEKVLNKSTREIQPEENYLPANAGSLSPTLKPVQVYDVENQAQSSAAEPSAPAVEEAPASSPAQEHPPALVPAAASSSPTSKASPAEVRAKKARRVVRNRNAASANFAQIDRSAAVEAGFAPRRDNRVILKPIR